MNRADIKPNAIVYHKLLVSLGPGRVLKVVRSSLTEMVFEKRSGRYRVIVAFEYGPKEPVRVVPSDLRKTPNTKRIKEMVLFYRERGRAAVDGGDRLILPDDLPRANLQPEGK
jgi:hypothetical protein